MMICPACNCELSASQESCENCDAPTYLAAAIQTSELMHCTYCGARDQVESSFCPACGLRKNFTMPENLTGICRNCGTTWKSGWKYCQLCGVARKNGLVELSMPPAALVLEPLSAGGKQNHFCNAVEDFIQPPQPTELYDDEITTLRRAYLAYDNDLDETAAPACEKEIALTEEQLTTDSMPDETPELGTSDQAENSSEPVINVAAPLEEETENVASASVQPASASDIAHDNSKRSWAKHYITLALILLGLVLVFSALKMSGIKLQDLFGRPRSGGTAKASLVPNTPDIRPPAGMVYISGGVFRMGADEGNLFEAPAHELTVASFFMDRTEVTNEQYAIFTKATNHAAPNDWKDGIYSDGVGNLPVVRVSWQDANDYARWAGKRLPTETEWEFAARANDGRRYPWGAEWEATKANTLESTLNHPVAVGSYTNAANPFGLLDLAGNVWEWTAGDVVSYKDPSIAIAPGKVIRGGAFYTSKERATTTYRSFALPNSQAVGIGFRCVKDVR